MYCVVNLEGWQVPTYVVNGMPFGINTVPGLKH